MRSTLRALEPFLTTGLTLKLSPNPRLAKEPQVLAQRRPLALSNALLCPCQILGWFPIPALPRSPLPIRHPI